MAIRSGTPLAVAAILVLTAPTHAKDVASPSPQFEFAWSTEERALALC